MSFGFIFKYSSTSCRKTHCFLSHFGTGSSTVKLIKELQSSDSLSTRNVGPLDLFCPRSFCFLESLGFFASASSGFSASNLCLSLWEMHSELTSRKRSETMYLRYTIIEFLGRSGFVMLLWFYFANSCF